MKASDPESEFLAQISVAGVPLPAVEYCGIPGRRFRFDFAWPELMLAVEIEGGTWAGGRHVTGAGFEQDCLKYNLAALGGWSVYRFTTAMVQDGRALETVERAIRRARSTENDEQS